MTRCMCMGVGGPKKHTMAVKRASHYVIGCYCRRGRRRSRALRSAAPFAPVPPSYPPPQRGISLACASAFIANLCCILCSFSSHLTLYTSHHIPSTMSTGYTIHVSGLAPETTEAKLHDFFSCK